VERNKTGRTGVVTSADWKQLVADASTHINCDARAACLHVQFNARVNGRTFLSTASRFIGIIGGGHSAAVRLRIIELRSAVLVSQFSTAVVRHEASDGVRSLSDLSVVFKNTMQYCLE